MPDKTETEVLREWLNTIATADEALRLAGAGFEHRKNLQAMKKYFNKKQSQGSQSITGRDKPLKQR